MKYKVWCTITLDNGQMLYKIYGEFSLQLVEPFVSEGIRKNVEEWVARKILETRIEACEIKKVKWRAAPNHGLVLSNSAIIDARSSDILFQWKSPFKTSSPMPLGFKRVPDRQSPLGYRIDRMDVEDFLAAGIPIERIEDLPYNSPQHVCGITNEDGRFWYFVHPYSGGGTINRQLMQAIETRIPGIFDNETIETGGATFMSDRVVVLMVHFLQREAGLDY